MSNQYMKELTLQELQDALDGISRQIAKGKEPFELPKELEGHINIKFKEGKHELYASNIIIVDHKNDQEKHEIVLPKGVSVVSCYKITSNLNSDDIEKAILFIDATSCLSFDVDGCNFSDIETSIKISQQKESRFFSDSSNLQIKNSDFHRLIINHETSFIKDSEFFVTIISKNNITGSLVINSHGNSDIKGKIYIFRNDISGVIAFNTVSENIQLGLYGGNIIGSIVVLQVYPRIIYWGHREKISENIKYTLNDRDYREKEFRPLIAENKNILMKFRQMAADRGDRLQESNINYNIAKFDELQFHADSRFTQEKVIIYLGRLLSRHGTSWLLPLAWIVAFNVFIAFVIFDIMDFYYPINISASDYLYIFGNLLNPLSALSDLIQNIDIGSTKKISPGAFFYISPFVAISKGLYAMCVYEFVRAARRFTLK